MRSRWSSRGSFRAPSTRSRAATSIPTRSRSSTGFGSSTTSAYLVGGSVRDLLLGRRPKDFDIGTSAHPYQVKKLFRNCWIIGRRFRLAHVKFGTKVIEVATFRRQVAAGEEVVQDGVPAPIHHPVPHPAGEIVLDPDHLIHRDNTFGTPEEDAFRRDFTINALFYDIATFSIIDYVGGLDDLRAGIVRAIGDPEVRFREDPVRMMRAVALAARLDFAIDRPVLDAIHTHRHEIARSSPPRLLEEYYKILRGGSSERTFRELAKLGLIEPISAELHHGAAESLWQSLAALDDYRRRFESAPDTLTNAILLGSLDRTARPGAGARPVAGGPVISGEPARRSPSARRWCKTHRAAAWRPAARPQRHRTPAADSCSAAPAPRFHGQPSRQARCCRTERSFARRSPGWRFMAVCQKSSTSGRPGSPTPTRRACHPAKHPARSPATTSIGARYPPTPPTAPAPSLSPRPPVGIYAIFELRASSIVLYGLASLSSVSARMTGHAGSNSLGLRLNFGLRGKP